MHDSILNSNKYLIIIFYIFAIFSILSFLFILTTLLLRIKHIRQKNKMERQTDLFSELLIQYLNDPADSKSYNELLRFDKNDQLLQFLLHYLQLLKGEERNLIEDLLNKLKIPNSLVARLQSKNKWQRAYAAYYLGLLNNKDSLFHLLVRLDDSFYLTQFYSARSIILLNPIEKMKTVIKKLFTIPQISSYQVMEGLMDLDENGLLFCHEIMQESRDSDEEYLLLLVDLFAYKRFGEAAVDILNILKTSQKRELKISCIRALGLLNYMPAVSVLRAIQSDPDWIIRSQALRALGRIGDIGSIPEFLEALKSDNFWIQYNAGLALYDLGEVGIEYLKKTEKNEKHSGQDIAKQIISEKIYVS